MFCALSVNGSGGGLPKCTLSIRIVDPVSVGSEFSAWSDPFISEGVGSGSSFFYVRV